MNIFKNNSFKVGLAIVLVLFMIMVVGFFWTPYNPNAIHDGILGNQFLSGPSSLFWFGTDNLGRDILSRLMVAIRNSFFVGTMSVLMSLTIGIVLGNIAGYFGGYIDEMIMRLVDALIAIPGLLFILIFISVFPQNIVTLIFAIGFTSFYSITRILRSKVMSVKNSNYILWAKSIGVSHFRIMTHHIFPELIPLILVAVPINFAVAILAEAVISYLGFTSPDRASFGSMLKDAQTAIIVQPFYAFIVGFFLTVSVVGLNLLSDGLQKYYEKSCYVNGSK